MNHEETNPRSKKMLDTKHSMKRRTPWHDYHRQGTYMLTLVVNERMPLFGDLKGNSDLSMQCLELNSMAEHLSRPVTTPHQPCGSYGTGGTGGNQVLSSSDNIINLNAPRLLSLVAQG